MQSCVIEEKDAGQRFDKYLHKLLGQAPGSFIYKMLRKKNITLNGKKADGSEKLQAEDEVKCFFSEETLAKFMTKPLSDTSFSQYQESYRRFGDLQIIFENDHVLIVNKPAGILTQKAKEDDLSLNEWLIGYLLSKKDVTAESLSTFRPSVCNRLDRNTSGMVICAKTLKGSQVMSGLLKERSLHKYYRLFVKGQVKEKRSLGGYLSKDTTNNTVLIKQVKDEDTQSAVHTIIEPVKVYSDKTLLEAELVTGKTHQIRAHLAGEGHPLLGDYKYGDRAFNDKYKRAFQVESQLLHAYKLVFPQLEKPLEALSGKTFTAPVPELFLRVGREIE